MEAVKLLILSLVTCNNIERIFPVLFIYLYINYSFYIFILILPIMMIGPPKPKLVVFYSPLLIQNDAPSNHCYCYCKAMHFAASLYYIFFGPL